MGHKESNQTNWLNPRYPDLLGRGCLISLETKELKIDFICMSLYSLHLGFLDGSVICYTGFSWTSVANKKEASHFYVHQLQFLYSIV